MSPRGILLGGLLLVLGARGAPLAAQQQCGSALLAEASAPAVFDGLQVDADSVARFWEAAAAATSFSSVGCFVGCTNVSGPQCAAGGDCVAITGVNWLSSFGCALAGHAPARTVFLIERPTAESGGLWVALNLASNPGDFNYDLDELAQVACGGCSSTASPYLGGSGAPAVDASSTTEGLLSASLSWSAPSSMAQLLSDGNDLVTSYALYYHPDDLGEPPPATGDKAGWTLVEDLEADGAAHGGYSTDTTAEVEVQLQGPIEDVYFAVGLNFDGTGDPGADANTVESTFLSDLSAPVSVPTPCGGSNHLMLEEQTVTTTEEFVACFEITAGNDFIVAAGGDVSFLAGESIALSDGFAVLAGGVFRAQVDPSLTEF